MRGFALWHGGGGGSWGFGAMRGGRRMKRGMLRWIVLKLIDEGNRHGYDILRVLSERSWGGGPGSVYPLLSMLEEEGLIVGRDQDGKRVYELTELGKQQLQSRGGFMEEFMRDFEESADDNVVAEAARKLVGAAHQARGLSLETRQKIAAVLDGARKEIYSILANE